MGIEVHLGDEILELINPSESLDGPKFSTKAAKTGTTSLYVSFFAGDLLFSLCKLTVDMLLVSDAY